MKWKSIAVIMLLTAACYSEGEPNLEQAGFGLELTVPGQYATI